MTSDPRVVVGVGVGDRDVAYLRRLRQTVGRFWSGPAVFFDGQFPPGTTEPMQAGARQRVGVRGPNTYALRAAVAAGYRRLAYVDAPFVVQAPVDPFFNHLEQVGYVLLGGDIPLRDWVSDAALAWAGLRREDLLPAARTVDSSFAGLDIDHPRGAFLFDRWCEAVERGLTRTLWSNDLALDRQNARSAHTGELVAADPTVQGHMGDDAVLGALVLKHDLHVEPVADGPWCSAGPSSIFRATGYDDGVMVFGGSGIVEDLYQWICANVPEGATILELGSGDVSTKYLSQRYRVISVEEDARFLNRYRAEYVHAPIENGWYATAPIAEAITRLATRGERYSLILIDGPSSAGQGSRAGFLDHAGLFDLSVPIVVDDADRPAEHFIAESLTKIVGRIPIWKGHYAIV